MLTDATAEHLTQRACKSYLVSDLSLKTGSDQHCGDHAGVSGVGHLNDHHDLEKRFWQGVVAGEGLPYFAPLPISTLALCLPPSPPRVAKKLQFSCGANHETNL